MSSEPLVVCIGYPGLLLDRNIERMQAIDPRIEVVGLPADPGSNWIGASVEKPHDEPPAWALGIDDQTGSLEVGKRGDIAVWDAHPFSVYAKARWVFVDGILRFDAQRPQVWSDFQIGQEVTP